MDQSRDPVERASDGETDLYDIATWEERTSVDGLSVALYRLLVASTRAVVIAAAFLILVGIGGLTAITDPQIGALTLLSALPALGLAGYVYYTDVTDNEPLSMLVVTFLLGVLTATFAAVLNSLMNNVGQTIASELSLSIGFLGSIIFFYLVVGPVEETVKLLAVRLYAYSHSSFNAVVDGAVYGAMAGLGFATIENALYITRNLMTSGLDLGTAGGVGIIGAGSTITAVRALAGPGHVIYSAIAGYYLGLAKFNKENAGPIVIKGLILASLVHATYNSTVGIGAATVSSLTGLGSLPSFLVYVLIYDGIFGLYLIGKIRRYSTAYHTANAPSAPASSFSSEPTEFED
ncbi:PrsW family intramembrane metalloprotease [Haloferax sp. MBLA0076]|uniref:PrsW family intramembrane metalloprotease n=1 Tax=Haloferax litoreum TaxID=2666140 RepID=A0A6A8GCK1_9EURY|nr:MULTISPECIES: PrsW family intramembrane metalloprotease [Haloferax]KAB1192533.1 PrsW family intramembrane metalloprotease [Haloferax sp. CBA1148]MRX21004.1 PrsW family intramembrane metalloprotease [Haloferax litoreum]